MHEIHQGDCIDLLSHWASGTRHFDAIITDPPYELNFMGRSWDNAGISFRAETWRTMLQVMKPGAHLIAFGGTRTYHRIACAIEDAGFEIRDSLMWVYGQGFPKSLDVSKAIDKARGAAREVVGSKPESAAWSGWGTALKPAYEPIILARKPLIGTVAENVLTHGCGGINVDGCRIETGDDLNGGAYANSGNRAPCPGDERKGAALGMFQPGKTTARDYAQPLGRWPANLIHDGSPEVLECFPQTTSGKPGIMRKGRNDGACLGAESRPPGTQMSGFGDSGSAARFFPTAAPTEEERRLFYSGKANSTDRAGSHHPTVKPVALMRWLCRLVTPPSGLILDPFAGSGTTGKAALAEGFDVVLIEQVAEYVSDIRRRLEMKGSNG
jgi:site-specific DNA-methyltransferase (adenine-specific)